MTDTPGAVLDEAVPVDEAPAATSAPRAKRERTAPKEIFVPEVKVKEIFVIREVGNVFRRGGQSSIDLLPHTGQGLQDRRNLKWWEKL